jgi:hypothetical protein
MNHTNLAAAIAVHAATSTPGLRVLSAPPNDYLARFSNVVYWPSCLRRLHIHVISFANGVLRTFVDQRLHSATTLMMGWTAPDGIKVLIAPLALILFSPAKSP